MTGMTTQTGFAQTVLASDPLPLRGSLSISGGGFYCPPDLGGQPPKAAGGGSHAMSNNQC